MKRKCVCLCCFLLFVSAGLFAQKDAKAKELLDKTSSIFKNAGNMSALFTFNVKDGSEQIAQSFEGQISTKGDKFYIDTPDQDIYFDGKTQWVYNKSYDEVNISEPDKQTAQALNPISFFEIYKKNCDYQYIGEKTDTKMQKVQEISIFPKNKKEDIKRIDIQLNTHDFMPVSFRIFYKNDVENNIYIHQFQTQQSFPDSRFAFDVKSHPEAEIIDLRN
jgi:outer membrane lipoprotein-sorting protein